VFQVRLRDQRRSNGSAWWIGGVATASACVSVAGSVKKPGKSSAEVDSIADVLYGR
jgi:hypothetical protein